DCHNHFNRAPDDRYQNTDHRHRFLTQICRTNHCRYQPTYDNIDIISAIGRDFYGKQQMMENKKLNECTYFHHDDFILAKEDIDASLDSTNDHVMHWTSAYVYMWWVTYSYYQKIKEEDNRTPYTRTPYYDNHTILTRLFSMLFYLIWSGRLWIYLLTRYLVCTILPHMNWSTIRHSRHLAQHWLLMLTGYHWLSDRKRVLWWTHIWHLGLLMTGHHRLCVRTNTRKRLLVHGIH
ncbi:hypothetical protein AGLY_014825, partial [Aphis glycines]